MSDDGDFENGFQWRPKFLGWLKRLVDNGRLGLQDTRQESQPVGLQEDQSIGEIQRSIRGHRMRDIAVEIGSGERDDQVVAGKCLVESGDRRSTAPRVQRDEQVIVTTSKLLCDVNLVPRFA